MVARIRSGLVLIGWTGLVTAALVGFHRLGDAFPPASITDSNGSIELALAAGLRLLGLAVGYWLLASTVIYGLGAVLRLPGTIRAVTWATPPLIRTLANRAAARTLVATLAIPLPLASLAPAPVALADAVEPGYVPIPAGDETRPTTTTTTIPSPTSEELPASSVAPEPTPSAPTMLAEEPEEAPVVIGGDLEVVVERGDHMWGLAKARLAVLLGRPPTDSEIAPYWQRVVEVNRDRIRSGDPDLIFPGEVLVLPKP